MASPMTADQFVAALKAEGVKVSEHAGWRTHNREGHGAWGPMNGVMIHHTAGIAPSDGNSVWSGRPDLPGPLAHSYLAKSGTATMTANGRANHAGGGSPAVLAAVINETVLPATHHHDGSAGAADGNSHFYGLEISNLGNGKDPYPAVQYDAAVRWAAAICRHHGWSAKSVIGHKEWSDWKPDPSFNITTFRSDVAARLAHPASWNPGSTPSAPAAPPEEDMALTDADARKVATANWTIDGVVANPNPDTAKDNPFIAPSTSLRNIETVSRRAEAKVDTLAETVAALQTTGLTDAQVAAIAGAVATNPVLVEALSTSLADKLAARLQA